MFFDVRMLAELWGLPKVGHSVITEQPELVIARLLDFLSDGERDSLTHSVSGTPRCGAEHEPKLTSGGTPR